MPVIQKRFYRCYDEYGRRRWCGLSTGAKWGIAWAVIVGVFLLFCLIGWGALKRRQRAGRLIVAQPPQFQPPPQQPQPPQPPQPYGYPMMAAQQPPQASGPFTMPESAVPLNKQYEDSAWAGPAQSPMTAPTSEQTGVSYPPPPGPPPPAYTSKY